MRSVTTHASPRTRARPHHVAGRRIAGCAVNALSLAGLALIGAPAGAASASALHLFQKAGAPVFTNATNQVLQGYPTIGGHVTENDVDYLGTAKRHASHPTATDHLFCTVVTAPATADCYISFAVGTSLLYVDDASIDLASSFGTITITGGTGKYAGYTGTIVSTTVGKTTNANLVLTLDKG
jgi:hypothetical protein